MEDKQNGRQPKWKTNKMEDISVRLQTIYQLDCNQIYQIEYDMVRGKLRLT